jgi:hypothetical protein
VLRVPHAKTATHSELPLLAEPGEALLLYLERARPRSVHREVFIRICAPHRPFKNVSILNCITRARLRTAGITPQGRKGPHAFRERQTQTHVCGLGAREHRDQGCSKPKTVEPSAKRQVADLLVKDHGL